MEKEKLDSYPKFLQSFEGLREHFEEHFEQASSGEKGNRFVNFVLKLVPLTEGGKRFVGLALNAKKSHDEGVDLFSAVNDSDERLIVQSKYKIRSKEEIDSVLVNLKATMTKKRD